MKITLQVYCFSLSSLYNLIYSCVASDRAILIGKNRIVYIETLCCRNWCSIVMVVKCDYPKVMATKNCIFIVISVNFKFLFVLIGVIFEKNWWGICKRAKSCCIAAIRFLNNSQINYLFGVSHLITIATCLQTLNCYKRFTRQHINKNLIKLNCLIEIIQNNLQFNKLISIELFFSCINLQSLIIDIIL